MFCGRTHAHRILSCLVISGPMDLDLVFVIVVVVCAVFCFSRSRVTTREFRVSANRSGERHVAVAPTQYDKALLRKPPSRGVAPVPPEPKWHQQPPPSVQNPASPPRCPEQYHNTRDPDLIPQPVGHQPQQSQLLPIPAAEAMITCKHLQTDEHPRALPNPASGGPSTHPT